MENCCHLADECPVYTLLGDPSRKAQRELYCLGEFGRCQRRQLLMSGQHAPDDMLPSGNLASRSDEQPRTIL